MISTLLQQIKNRHSQQVQFRLGHKSLIQIEGEWTEFDDQSLSLSDWEDLKDLCLQNNEKVILETKGFVQGVFSDPMQSWSFSFTEWKDCLRAHFFWLSREKSTIQIQFSPYFDSLKKKSGLHIVGGMKNNGKSTLISEIISEGRKYSPELVAVHAPPTQLSLSHLDSVVHLGMESLAWDSQHPIYDGIDSVVVDANDIQNLNKWIKFSEEGRSVYLSLSAGSVENILLQIKSLCENQKSLWSRFCQQLSSVIYQKKISMAAGSVHEIWVLQKEDQKNIQNKFETDKFSELISNKNTYQSLNQSILQSLVRRKIDVKLAFGLSDDIETLDRSLKKMGL
jgi:twitching motility protein PilT